MRKAEPRDIARLIEIRAAVRENRLQSRAIGAADYRPYVEDGRCWVWEEAGAVLGFAALDADAASVWALFVAPDAEGRGIGRALLDTLVAEAHARDLPALTLETMAGTRAERLYRAAGWMLSSRDADGNLTLNLSLARP